jgi:hypothetical protein
VVSVTVKKNYNSVGIEILSNNSPYLWEITNCNISNYYTNVASVDSGDVITAGVVWYE